MIIFPLCIRIALGFKRVGCMASEILSSALLTARHWENSLTLPNPQSLLLYYKIG